MSASAARGSTYAALIAATLSACFHGGQVPAADGFAMRETAIRELMTRGTAGLRAGERGGESGLDRAEAAFLTAHQLDPLDPRAIDGLGCVALRRLQLEVAEKHFQRAIELHPGYDRPFAHLAAVAELRGDHVAARMLFERALRLNPLNYRARNNYAALLADVYGERFRAFRELQQASEASGETASAITGNISSLDELGITSAGPGRNGGP